ncbi:uncharacterized protein NESG_01764 [Nematocida ausubeli]|uniref:Uncharacterized protein n=1 Tax=Nematocida ausubeli (strain ATCC PRA-371 / ERTm2) TaxID=1913371 RepID=A0A086J0W2_NEMA1|nr:uncharacterized protein NESG_01764 [Nematocida ausubeli]KAI5136337.1 hypothetical protein NEAUS06_1871 [Nematocida ausubeli]KFG25780.1 hypothetical protein NESG_01764 [Nematocida ausubeli]
MHVEKASQIQKLKNTCPWVIYYAIATVNFAASVYSDCCSCTPFGILSNPLVIFTIITMFVFFSVYIQSPPSVIAHTRPVSNIILVRFLMLIVLCNAIVLGSIIYMCLAGKYYTMLFFSCLLIQIGIYSEYILKIVSARVSRLPVENYILSISIEMEMDERDMTFYDFHLLFYAANFLFIFFTSVIVFFCVHPVSMTYTSFFIKNLYCLVTYYCGLYTFMSACVVTFYLKINSGSQSFYRLITKLVVKNIGVIVFMAVINPVSAVCEFFVKILSISTMLESLLSDIGNRFFKNIIFYRKIGISSIVAMSTLLEKEPHEVVAFIKEIEGNSDYPYISSFSTTHSGQTTEKLSTSIIFFVLLPLLIATAFTTQYADGFEGYIKMLISLGWVTYATACVWYIYSESLYYAALLSNIQGSPQGKKWINAYLNTL